MMRFDRFTERAQDAIARSQEILLRYQHSQLDLEHIMLALLEDIMAGRADAGTLDLLEKLARTVQTGFDRRTGQAIFEKYMARVQTIDGKPR